MNTIYCKCKDCTKRHVDCHAHCKDYKAFKHKLHKRKGHLGEFVDEVYFENVQ